MSALKGLRHRLRPQDTGAKAEPVRRSALDCRTELAGVLSMYGWGIRGAIVVGGLALLFTMVNVQIFGSAGHQPGTDMESTFLWGIAWLLDPMASVGLAVAILFEGLLARYGCHEAWLTGVKWFAGVMTWTMNIWPAVDVPHPSGLAAGIVLHSVAPGLVLGLAEAAPRVRRKLTGIITELEREAQSIEAAEAAERHTARQRQAAPGPPAPPPAPVGPPAPALRAFPHWPDTAPPVRPAGAAQPAPVSRPGPGTPGRAALPRQPRSDERLVAAVREMTERNGGVPPSQYRLRQALGVGGGRAARLLSGLTGTTPAGDPATGGVPIGKDGTS